MLARLCAPEGSRRLQRRRACLCVCMREYIRVYVRVIHTYMCQYINYLHMCMCEMCLYIIYICACMCVGCINMYICAICCTLYAYHTHTCTLYAYNTHTCACVTHTQHRQDTQTHTHFLVRGSRTPFMRRLSLSASTLKAEILKCQLL